MRTIWRGAAVLVGLALMSTPGMAQHPRRGLTEVRDGGRGGFWAGFGVGAGGEAFDLRDGLGYSEMLYRPTVALRFGGTVNPALRLGGEISAWINEQGSATETLSSFLFTTQLYPAGNAGLYLKGGIGLGRHAVEINNLDDGRTGFAGLVGAGYELRVGRHMFLVPSVDLVQQWYSERDTAGYHERLLNFGLGFVFQTGR